VPSQWVPGSLAALGNAVVGGQENGSWGKRGAAYVCRAKYGSSTVYGGKARAGLHRNAGKAECFVGLPDGREAQFVDAGFELLVYWPPPSPPLGSTWRKLTSAGKVQQLALCIRKNIIKE